jgi:hypothetical protein
VSGRNERARNLLARTQDFDCFDHGYQLVLQMRMVCRDNLDLLEELEAERSVRRALQARCEEQQAILGARLNGAARRLAS